MDISWYGLSCFRIREAGTVVICDPFDKKTGLSLAKTKADIVSVSVDSAGHNAVDRITSEPKVLRNPGEYEIGNVFVNGLATWRAGEDSSSSFERNVAFFYDFEGLTVGHLGEMEKVPKQSAIDELDLGELDVLLVPVGGGRTLDATRAVEVVGMLEPKLVIPMHYHQPGLKGALADLEPVDKFLKELGIAEPEPQSTLRISKSALSEETQVALLTAS